MGSVQRTAGVAGTFAYTLSVDPFGVPSLTIYSDALRTVVAVAAANLAATGNPQVFTASYPALLAAGTYYLKFSTVITDGQAALVDADDELVLVVVNGSVNDLARLRELVGEPDDANGWTDARLTEVQGRWLCPHTEDDGSITYTNDVFGAAAEAWETKALALYTTARTISSERNLDVSVTYKDGASAPDMLKIAKRMLRKSCAWAGGTRTVPVLNPDDKRTLDLLDSGDLLGDYGEYRVNAPEPKD